MKIKLVGNFEGSRSSAADRKDIDRPLSQNLDYTSVYFLTVICYPLHHLNISPVIITLKSSHVPICRVVQSIILAKIKTPAKVVLSLDTRTRGCEYFRSLRNDSRNSSLCRKFSKEEHVIEPLGLNHSFNFKRYEYKYMYKHKNAF